MEEHAKEKASEYGSVEMIKQLQELGQLSSDLHKVQLKANTSHHVYTTLVWWFL